METGDDTEGTPGCLREGDDGEVGFSGKTTTRSTRRRTTILDYGRGQELLVKEALHIQMIWQRSASIEMED